MPRFGPFILENWSIRKIFVLSLFVHFITALFSEGFFQFDEHFQILEFLGHKLNSTAAIELPWEYTEKIRPWFQVFLYYILILPFKGVGIASPFIQATIFRVLTSFFALYSVYSLKDFLEDQFKSEKLVKITFILLLFSWFVPVVHARASSENLSAAFIFFGFSWFWKSLKLNHFRQSFIAGLFLAAAYLTKSQLSLVVAFLWFWALLFERDNWKVLVGSALSIIIMIGLGIVFDYWGYGEWTFSTWNYFTVNILQDRVSGFGVDPWWYYFKLLTMKGLPPLSLVYLLAGFYFWYKYWKHPVTWMSFPFFVIHCLIGHKELRFIFFVVLISPFMLVYILDKKKWLDKKIVHIFLILNLIILIPAGLKAANSSIRFFKYIHENKITAFKAHGENPFTMVGLKMNFYMPQNLKVEVFKENPSEEKGFIFFKSGKKYFEYHKKENCELQYLSYPKWSLNFNIGNWISRSRVWSLWKCS